MTSAEALRYLRRLEMRLAKTAVTNDDELACDALRVAIRLLVVDVVERPRDGRFCCDGGGCMLCLPEREQ